MFQKFLKFLKRNIFLQLRPQFVSFIFKPEIWNVPVLGLRTVRSQSNPLQFYEQNKVVNFKTSTQM